MSCMLVDQIHFIVEFYDPVSLEHLSDHLEPGRVRCVDKRIGRSPFPAVRISSDPF